MATSSPRAAKARARADDARAALGLARNVVAVVPDFTAATAVASASELVAFVTRSCREPLLGYGVRSFPLPVVTDAIPISQL